MHHAFGLGNKININYSQERGQFFKKTWVSRTHHRLQCRQQKQAFSTAPTRSGKNHVKSMIRREKAHKNHSNSHPDCSKTSCTSIFVCTSWFRQNPSGPRPKDPSFVAIRDRWRAVSSLEAASLAGLISQSVGVHIHPA